MEISEMAVDKYSGGVGGDRQWKEKMITEKEKVAVQPVAPPSTVDHAGELGEI
jgi:hypothetical protein